MNKAKQVIRGFRDLYNKMVVLNKFKMEASLKGYKSSEVHCIEYIGKNVDSNVTKLAESFYMTRGAISKVTKKLIKKDILEMVEKLVSKNNIKHINNLRSLKSLTDILHITIVGVGEIFKVKHK